MAIHAVGGDLPPIGDVLADLVAVAVPLTPLAVVLGCREAHLVLLQEEQHRGQQWFESFSQRGGESKQENLDAESSAARSTHDIVTWGMGICCMVFIMSGVSLPQ